MEGTNHQDDNEENGGDIAEEVVEDSDDEDEDYNRLQHTLDGNVLQRLKKNDPAVSDLYINLCIELMSDSFFNSIDWKEDGNCISNNKQLKRIHITNDVPNAGFEQAYILGEEVHNLPTRQQLQDFFSCLYRNRSIETIRISTIQIVDEFGGGLIEGLSGHRSLKKIEVGYAYNTLHKVKIGSIGCEALGKVLNHPESKLKHLRISYCQLDDEGVGALCDGLLGNSTIKSLCLSGNDTITSLGWRALVPVLQHENCKLVALDLNSTGINDDTAVILGSALRGSSVKTLNLSANYSISSAFWHMLLNQLSQTSIESLKLSSNQMGGAGLNDLANLDRLQSLVLGGNGSISPECWRSFFTSLQTRGTKLKKLDISGNDIGDIGTVALGNLLNGMSTLTTLEMSYSNITPQVWVSFFTSLQDSNLNLERLNLSHCDIDDEGIQILTTLVSSMDSLKFLCLDHNELVSPTGWQALLGFIQHPNFALEELTLGENNVDDDTLIPLTIALVNNKTLQRLYFEQLYDDDTGEYFTLITERGWSALSNLLCNKTSIMDTYTSNHTLNYVYCEYRSDDLRLHLKLNENKDKVEVARQKILQTHLSSGDTSKMQELLDMELEMMPSVMNWIGRPAHDGWRGANVSGLSAMYNLTRRVPDLFDSMAQKKPSMEKRKG